MLTEIAIPSLAVILDVSGALSFGGDLDKECFFNSNSSAFLFEQFSKLSILFSQKDHVSESEWAVSLMEYVFMDLVANPDTWLLGGCLLGDLNLFYSSLDIQPQPCVTRTMAQLGVNRTKLMPFAADSAATPVILGRRAAWGR